MSAQSSIIKFKMHFFSETAMCFRKKYCIFASKIISENLNLEQSQMNDRHIRVKNYILCTVAQKI